MQSQNLIEKRLIQNLLRLEFCAIEAKNSSQNVNYCIGFRKGISLLNIENSIINYFKVLNIIKGLKKTKRSILFVGYPLGLEKKIKSFFPEFYRFFYLDAWLQEIFFSTYLLKTKTCFVIAFCDRVHPSFNTCFIKSIPLVKFIFEGKNRNSADYLLLMNLRSKGCIGLFLYLLNKSS